MWLHDGDKTSMRNLAKQVAYVARGREMETPVSFSNVGLLDTDTQGAVNLERLADFQ